MILFVYFTNQDRTAGQILFSGHEDASVKPFIILIHVLEAGGIQLCFPCVSLIGSFLYVKYQLAIETSAWGLVPSEFKGGREGVGVERR